MGAERFANAFVNKMHALWGLTMSLRAPKVSSAWECRPAPAEAVAYSRRQARFSIRRRTACRRCPIRSHIPKSTLDAKHSAIFHLSIAWMRPITTIYFTALAECHTKFAPWHALPEDNRALLVFGVPNAAARRQTAACVSGHGSQTACAKDPSSITALPCQSDSGRVVGKS